MVAGAIGEPAIDEAVTVEPPAPARPARSPGLFGGLRRNAPNAKSPKAKSPKVKSPRPTPPPEPSPDLEEFENWEDEETIESAIVSEAAIEAVERVEPEAETIEDVVVVIEPEAAIEAVVLIESEEGAIEEVAIVVETDDPPSIELIEVEVIEEFAPPIEAAIEPVGAASTEADSSPEGEDAIAPKPPAPEVDQA
ncbi:MAG: hypothetical protein HC895_04965 [Leptolyngbyaceae cyanobacterium SM1_3_5]|nr:hypothetical protein [Leptolyngbyaceae cyanobacterium SM1_3_5]